MTDEPISTRIKKLSPLLINQLAAGEVVTRPAAVVKELLENAIDAEATEIDIHITQGGMGMIQVCDNGTGIYPEDMVMAITRHATSKVADIGTLQGIRTLGFRGEALAAIAAVSRLQLISSHNADGIGRQLQVAGVLAETPVLTPVVHGRGTTVTIKDLYFNVPARRGNLKSVATEFAHIEAMVREVALARSDIRIHLTHDHKKRLLLDAHQNSDHSAVHPPLSRLEQALEMPLSECALPLHVDLSSLLSAADNDATGQMDSTQARIDGWLLLPQEASSNLPKLIYINGRLVKEPIISNHLRQLTEQATGYALYFQLPTHWLNLNVHPSKQRIKIGSISNILAHLSHAVRNAMPTAERTEPLASTTTTSTHHANASNHTYHSAPADYQRTMTNTDRASAVHAPTTAYQSEPIEQPKQNAQPSARTTSIEDTFAVDNSSDNYAASALDIRCLGVIEALPTALLPEDASDALWLLFLAEDTCCLMTVEAWQSLVEVSAMTTASDTNSINTQSPKYIETQIHAALAQLSITEQQPLWQQIKTHSKAVLTLSALSALMLQHAMPTVDTVE